MVGRKQTYKITYPNGLIYVGMDLTGDRLYVGSPSAREVIAADLGIAVLPHHPLPRLTIISGGERDYMLTFLHLGVTFGKRILWDSDVATDAWVRAVEVEFIRDARANDPKVGYNRTPRFVGAG